MTTAALLASIPSPGSSSIHIGPLEVRAYGLAIGVGVVVAMALARQRWADRGGDPDDVSRLATWSVVAGLVGARAYHVLTDYHRFQGHWLDVVKVWEGGLGIPGGLLAGVVTGVVLARRRGLPAAQLLDVVAPAIPVAQAIGRLGNWFNQELFGRPTSLPWGLRIDVRHRPDGYEQVATFHPTFLYEALWNLALAGLLVRYERRRPGGRPGQLFALYVGGYGLGRLWVEALRIDDATRIAGVRVNIWVSLVAVAAASVAVARLRHRSPSAAADTLGEVAGSEGVPVAAHHWDEVYRTKRVDEVSWYQDVPAMSLRLLSEVAPAPASIVDVGAGASVLVDALLASGYGDVTVLDVSDEALAVVRARLGGDRRTGASFVAADVRTWEPERTFDAWHDRAVFHFLVDPHDRERYAATVARAVAPGGVAVIGAFALDGPEQCSGLPTARYDASGLAEELGAAFHLERAEREIHHTPGGAAQPFTWVVLRRT